VIIELPFRVSKTKDQDHVLRSGGIDYTLISLQSGWFWEMHPCEWGARFNYHVYAMADEQVSRAKELWRWKGDGRGLESQKAVESFGPM